MDPGASRLSAPQGPTPVPDGTNGPRDVLLQRAVDWCSRDGVGDTGLRALAASIGTAPPPWRDARVRMIESLTAYRALFAASIEAAVLAQRSDPIRELLGASPEHGRSGLAAALLAAPEDGLDRADVRSVRRVRPADPDLGRVAAAPLTARSSPEAGTAPLPRSGVGAVLAGGPT